MRPVSVVINTFNRVKSLATTLQSLRGLDTSDVEVIVVNGPSTDGTAELLKSYGADLKIGRCPTLNLSRSRNIGVRLAAGEIVAFIDDDAVADPAWLEDLVPLFEDEAVGAAGGPVFDHTGVSTQAHYIVSDRFGDAELRRDRDPSPLLNLPYGAKFCSTLGTNSLFRRSALVAIGGFDEEYEYFLDETDVCLRMLDAGWQIRHGSTGLVYHYYLPSNIRNEFRVVQDYGPVIKNKTYFAMRYGAPAHGQAAVQAALDAFAQKTRETIRWAVENGRLTHAHAREFDRNFEERVREGMRKAFQPRRSSLDARHPGPELPMRRFPTAAAGGQRRLHLCLVSQEYPPGIVAGIARVTYELATGLARAGHVVRVLTRAQAHTVHFEDGVWVHRLPDLATPPPREFAGLPARIWGRAEAVLHELRRIQEQRPIDLVQAPNWDAEGLAAIHGGRWPVVLGLYTPMTIALAHNEGWQADKSLIREALLPIADAERYCYRHASAALACGPAIVDMIQAEYGVTFGADRIGLVPHGRADRGRAPPPPATKDTVDILCVGRLEERKGTDVLLAAVPALFADAPHARLLLAGDDAIAVGEGTTIKQTFLRDPANAPFLDRVAFLGKVDECTLDDLYRRCDIVVVPSRFESFGLPVIEAMMRARPVVASDVGGMTELLASGCGLLVPVGDRDALAEALRTLIASPAERRRMGERGREQFERHYEQDIMVRRVADFYRDVLADG